MTEGPVTMKTYCRTASFPIQAAVRELATRCRDKHEIGVASVNWILTALPPGSFVAATSAASDFAGAVARRIEKYLCRAVPAGTASTRIGAVCEMRQNLHATYLIRSPAEAISARAQALALEQSVEMPLAALTDARVKRDVVAQIESISERSSGVHAVRLALARETVGDDAGQLMNMLFGNSSLLPDIQLEDIDLPVDAAKRFGGPALGIAGIRALVRVAGRALTCTALKPIGSSVAQVSRLAALFADAGIDVIKEDHGWAESDLAPFHVRVPACQRAIAATNRGKGERQPQSQYSPSLSG